MMIGAWALAEGLFFLDDFVRIAGGAHAHQLLRGVELAAQHGQHIHPGHRLALQQDRDVVAVHFQADRFFQSDSIGLMRGLLQHRSEAEEFSRGGFIDDDLLMIFVNGSHPDRARDHDIGLPARVADLPDTLARSECLQFYLRSEDCGFFIVEQSKERNLSQDFWIACHFVSPR